MFFHGQNLLVYVHKVYDVSGALFYSAYGNSLFVYYSYHMMRTFPWQMFLDFLKETGKVQVPLVYFPWSC